MRYRTRRMDVKAVQLGESDNREVAEFLGIDHDPGWGDDGVDSWKVVAEPGDWIVRTDPDHFYAVRPALFDALFEAD